MIAGAIAYWCEGAKSKPYRHAEEVNFINSDVGLIRLFLQFLDLAGIARERLRYRVHIHETADLDAETSYWQAVIGAGPESFSRPNIKRHKPQINRRNTGADYHGCLQIRVSGSRDLYRRIQGWASAAMAAGISAARVNDNAPGP